MLASGVRYINPVPSTNLEGSMVKSQLILASGSPRRRDLLNAAGVKFDIVESGVDEEYRAGETAAGYALRVACEKSLAVSHLTPQALVLGADTVVEIDGELLMKPIDADDARRMLSTLAGQTHTVITAYAIAHRGQIVESAPVTARVTFRPLSKQDIDDYLRTGEPFDKAGSYGIQGQGAGFITAVAGSRDTVMGLPVAEVLGALGRCGFDANRE